MSFLAAIESPFTVFEPAYAQRALLAVMLIAVLAGAVGSAIVLRDLPFFTHAVGAGAYPFLVIALAIGVALPIGAVVGALAFAAIVATVTGRTTDPGRRDAFTGLLVAAALATGAVIAATAASGDTRLVLTPEALLFGSLFAVGEDTLLAALLVAVLIAPISLALADRWIATGFDPHVARRLGVRRTDLALLVAVALAAAVTLPLTGSLLAGALLVIPAATTRLVIDHKGALAPVTFLIALIEGILGLYLSIVLDLPAGATIAVVAGAGFALTAAYVVLGQLLRRVRAARSLSLAALAAVAVLAASGCGGSDSNESDSAADSDAVSVVATTPQVADIVEQVGGDAVTVKTIMPAGTDPHEFESKPSDIAAMADADVIFRSGGELDAWVDDAAKNADGPVPVDVSASVALIESDGEHAEEDHADEGGFNAHWYLAPANLSAASQRVRDELVKAVPAERETVRANADEYAATIDGAYESLTACVKKVPTVDRSFVSGHDDFAYLADAFGLKVAAQLAESGQTEPSAKQLQEAVDAARDGNSTAVATSNGEASQLATQVADRLNVPLLELYADSLAASGQASTAVGAIEFNVSQLVDAMSDGSVECTTTG